MTVHPAITRLRAADRSPQESPTDERLFTRIVATPGDPRLGSTHNRRGRRRVAVAMAVGVALIGTGAAWAAVTSDATHLFLSNPQDSGKPGSLWHQSVIASSVNRAATVRIPGSGTAVFWYAKTRQGGWCAALRLPSGHWSGMPGGGSGTVPGCFPTRTQINGLGKVYVITGFDYEEGLLTVKGHLWRIYYGVVDGKQPVVRVIDRESGRSAPVKDGHLFAIAIPDADPTTDSVRFVALDNHGTVVADEAHPLN